MSRIVFFIIALASHNAFAADYYVDNSVGSSGNGSIGSPWKNFSDINWTTIGGASKPCTIFISGGASSQTYNVSAEYMINASGSGVGSEIILKRPTSAEWSGHSGTVIIAGGDGGRTFNITSRNYVIVDGLEFYPGNLWLQSCNYVIIRNCWIHGWKSTQGADGGITTLASAGSPSSYVTIQNNRIGPPDNTAQQDPIILGWNDHWIIEKNIFEYSYTITSGSHADGIHMQGDATNLTIRYNWFRGGFLNAAIFVDTEPGNNDTGPMNVDVYGNIFENCTSHSSDGWQGILVYHAGTYNQHILNIYNNVFLNLNSTDASGFAIWIRAGATASEVVKIENNIFYNAKVGIETGTTTNFTMNNNWYFNDDGIGGGVIIQWKDTDYTNINTFNSATGFEASRHQSNPGLVSVNSSFTYNHDFRPAAGSPVINAGATESSTFQNGISTVTAVSDWPYYTGSGALGSGVTLIQRPQGAAWDIGAYEWFPIGNIHGGTMSGCTLN